MPRSAPDKSQNNVPDQPRAQSACASVWMRSLADSVPRSWPERRIPRCVNDGEHKEMPRVNAKEHCIWKARHVGASNFPVNPAKCLGKPFDSIEGPTNLRKEFLPQAGALLLVPPICRSQIPPYRAAVYDRKRHQRRRASANTSSRDTTSSGLRSCSATRLSINA